MTSFSGKIERRELKAGDHIYRHKKLPVYAHQGIYVGDERVIHFTNTTASSILSSKSKRPACEICGYDKKKHKGVVKTCVECFSRGRGLYLFKYGVSSPHFFLHGVGTCSTNDCHDPDTVVRRAESLLAGENGGFGEYSFTKNNCEHFAFYCKTEVRFAHQVVYWKAFAEIAMNEVRHELIITPNWNLNFIMLAKSLAKIPIMAKKELHKKDQMAHRDPDTS